VSLAFFIAPLQSTHPIAVAEATVCKCVVITKALRLKHRKFRDAGLKERLIQKDNTGRNLKL
jgi:hypothetical protein